MASIEIEGKPQIDMAHSVTIPGRTLAIVCIYNNLDPHQSGSLYEIEPNGAIINKYPNLCIITIHCKWKMCFGLSTTGIGGFY